MGSGSRWGERKGERTIVGYHTPSGIAPEQKNTGSTRNPLRLTNKHVVGTKWGRELDSQRTSLEPPTNPRRSTETQITQKMGGVV